MSEFISCESRKASVSACENRERRLSDHFLQGFILLVIPVEDDWLQVGLILTFQFSESWCMVCVNLLKVQ